jgi:hypothetical protein
MHLGQLVHCKRWICFIHVHRTRATIEATTLQQCMQQAASKHYHWRSFGTTAAMPWFQHAAARVIIKPCEPSGPVVHAAGTALTSSPVMCVVLAPMEPSPSSCSAQTLLHLAVQQQAVQQQAVLQLLQAPGALIGRVPLPAAAPTALWYMDLRWCSRHHCVWSCRGPR